MEEKILEAAGKERSAAAVIKLSKPFTWEGTTYEELEFDFSTLTGADSLAVEEELLAQGSAPLVPELSGAYLVRIAARACKSAGESGGQRMRLGADGLRALPIRDYNRIIKMAKNFLLLGG